jgi:predicted dehydrogenase
MTEALRVALVGCGTRGRGIYLPVLAAMSEHFTLCAACDSDPDKSAGLDVPGYTDVTTLLAEQKPDACVIAVTPPPSPANGRALLACARGGVPALAETPIASDLADADQIVAAVAESGAPVEIGENYYRTPHHRFVQELLRANVFGQVNVAYADFVGHGYHGIALLRAYLGRHREVIAVHGDSALHSVLPHAQRPGEAEEDHELWQFGVLEFDHGGRGVFSFSTLSYHSPLRPRTRSEVRFLASHGMGVGAELTTANGPLSVRQVQDRVGGLEVIAQIGAIGTDVCWTNPLRHYPLTADGDQHSPLTVGLQLLALHKSVTEGAPPEYGVLDASYDRAIDLAMTESMTTREPCRPARGQLRLPSSAQ